MLFVALEEHREGGEKPPSHQAFTGLVLLGCASESCVTELRAGCALPNWKSSVWMCLTPPAVEFPATSVVHRRAGAEGRQELMGALSSKMSEVGCGAPGDLSKATLGECAL